jgi:hypothetical protein
MAETSGYTLGQLLQPRLDNMDAAVSEARNDDPALKAKHLPGLAISLAARRAAEKVRAALDIDVIEPIARAWANAPELRKGADEADLSADKTAVVSLGAHHLSASYSPIADVTFATIGALKLVFSLSLSVGVNVADVTIADRKIVKIGKLEGQAGASLSLGPFTLSHPVEHTKLLLHDEIVLAVPVPIAPAAGSGGG